jgi:hypothetical protein
VLVLAAGGCRWKLQVLMAGAESIHMDGVSLCTTPFLFELLKSLEAPAHLCASLSSRGGRNAASSQNPLH